MEHGQIISVELYQQIWGINMTIKQLKEYDKLYELGLSPISDKEYDDLKDTERDKNPNDPYFDSVGFVVDSREKVKLPFVLGSLNKVKAGDGTISKWLMKQKDIIIISPKLDGLSICVNWFDGEVVCAYLRGDGEYGMNITSKAKKFIKPIECNGSIWARGEVLLKSLPEGYKTKRNAVAGIINEENSEHLKLLVPMFYEYLNADTPTEFTRINYLSIIGLPVVKTVSVNYDDITEKYLIEMLSDFKGYYPEFELDGLVLTKDSSEREDVKYPDQKIAFKVNQAAIPAVVESVEWNVSRNGLIKPVVIIHPVVIGGVTITRASGFNAKYIIDNRIEPGVNITIVRSGEVIPYIVDVEPGKKGDIPTKCPDCGNDVIMPDDNSVDIKCDNDNCGTKRVKKLEYFLKTIGVMGISKATLEKLGVASIYELYELTVNDITKLEGFGTKKADAIYNEIRNKLVMSQSKFLASIGIQGLGNTVADLILENIPFDKLFETTDFSFIDGIGDVISNNIINGLPEIFHNYVLLSNYGLKWEEKSKESELYGKVFTVTGTAPIKRDDLVRILESHGCRVKSISKSTNFLVTDDMDSNSSKAKKARDYGIPFMSYDELMNKLGIVE